ncbi:Thylakoid lumenal 15 kDa protein 1, chloroplastic [Vitis vinifera]|uniref:Thylakoid lumenal 15 kDa protein 1, chloroplastic n=1 Tax=Vitis vinifera TaxID=29760 RepID=A0A438JXI2_VITVI|nr:Thylakoid lumenal 15 kDa protein 1, chloroplastic [Vitis vinifera]
MGKDKEKLLLLLKEITILELSNPKVPITPDGPYHMKRILMFLEVPPISFSTECYKKMKHIQHDLAPTQAVLTRFNGEPSYTVGQINLEVNIAAICTFTQFLIERPLLEAFMLQKTPPYPAANLSNANLEGALATGNTSFRGSIITGADFTDVPLREDQRNTFVKLLMEGNRIAAMYQLQFSFEMRLVPGLLWSLIPFCCSVTHPFSFIFGWAFTFNVSDTTVAGSNYVCEDASQVRRLVLIPHCAIAPTSLVNG